MISSISFKNEDDLGGQAELNVYNDLGTASFDIDGGVLVRLKKDDIKSLAEFLQTIAENKK